MGQSPPGSTYNEEGDGLPFFQGRRDFGFRYPTKRVFCSSPRRTAENGDTLVSVRAPVGDVNMAAEKICVGRGVAGVRHRSGSRSYTYYTMVSMRDRFREYESEGTVFGAISKGKFTGLEWVSSPSGVVEAFENRLFAVDETIRLCELESMQLASVRDALLPKLLSGDLPSNASLGVARSILGGM
jgi:type I restriction enzyme S subunit